MDVHIADLTGKQEIMKNKHKNKKQNNILKEEERDNNVFVIREAIEFEKEKTEGKGKINLKSVSKNGSEGYKDKDEAYTFCGVSIEPNNITIDINAEAEAEAESYIKESVTHTAEWRTDTLDNPADTLQESADTFREAPQQQELEQEPEQNEEYTTSDHYEIEYNSPPASILSSSLTFIGAISGRLNVGLHLQGMLGITSLGSHRPLVDEDNQDDEERRTNVHYTWNRPYSRLIRAQRRLAASHRSDPSDNNEYAFDRNQGDSFSDSENDGIELTFNDETPDLETEAEAEAGNIRQTSIGFEIGNQDQNQNENSHRLRNPFSSSINILTSSSRSLNRIRQRRRSTAFDPFASYFFVVYHFSIVLILAVMLLILIYNFLHSTPISFR